MKYIHPTTQARLSPAETKRAMFKLHKRLVAICRPELAVLCGPGAWEDTASKPTVWASLIRIAAPILSPDW